MMIERMGPEARLRDAADGLTAMGRVAQNLPQLLRNAEVISAMLADGRRAAASGFGED
ncbi:MAG: hypothetical protein WDM81_14880 [Rhizomicrobium sp.]